MMDALQVLKLLEESHLPRSGLTREKSSEERAEAQALWESIQGALSHEREQQVAYLLYNCGLTPVEIMHIFPQEFSDMREISRVRLAVIKLVGSTCT
jgi:DNA-directed RNA polymerase specialized sigma subunit